MASKVKSDSDPSPSRANRLAIPLTANGNIDWDNIRPSVREQYLSLVNEDVTTLEHIGMAHESGMGMNTDDGETLPEVTNENVTMALDILCRTNALVFRMAVPKLIAHPVKSQIAKKRVPLEIDLDIATQAFQLTKKQHEELDPRALRLAKKYMPQTARKNLDIWMLVGMFLKYQADNAQTAIKAQISRDILRMNQQQAARPEPPKPDVDQSAYPASVPPNGHAPAPSGETLEPGFVPDNMEPPEPAV